MSDHDPTAGEMHREHEALSQKIGLAKESLEKVHSPADSYQRLRKLRDELQRHFALEEQGGYMREVRERRPNWSDRIDELRRQHAQMLVDVGALVDEADELVQRTEEWQGKFEQLLAALSQHEQAENEIVQKAYQQDIGDKD